MTPSATSIATAVAPGPWPGARPSVPMVPPRLPQVLINVKGVDKHRVDDDEGVQAAVTEVQASLADEGRVLLRKSGTEPVVRVMVEAPDEETAGREAQVLADVVQRELRLHD